MKAIIFDMDGVMVDSEKLYNKMERDIAIEYGKILTDTTIMKMMGRSPMEAVRIYIEDLALDVDENELLKRKQAIMKQKYQHELEPMKGLFEILDTFYNKKRMAISTGSPLTFLNIVLDTFVLRKYFDVLQTSDTITKGKPDPEIYLKTIEKLKLLPTDCIVLEDSRNGALAARTAGCYTIGVYTEHTEHEDFSFVDYFAKDLLDAKQHILKL